MSSYRTAPRVAPETVIVYRSLGRGKRLFATAALLLNFVFSVGLAAFAGGRVTVDLSRAPPACTVTKTYALYRTVNVYPLVSIQGTELETVRSDEGDGYQVVLKTSRGLVALSGATAPRAVRGPQKDAIDQFLANPGVPPHRFDYDTPQPWCILLLVWGGVSLFILCGVWQRAVVRFDWATSTVFVERSPWPLWRSSRSFSLDHVTGVEIDRAPVGENGMEYWVVLTHAAGDRVRLLPGSSGRFADHVPAAEEIRAALQHKDAARRGEWPVPRRPA